MIRLRKLSTLSFKFKSDLITDYASVFVELVVGLIIMTLINKNLGVQAYGSIIALFSILTLFTGFVTSNNQSGVAKYVAISLYEKNQNKLNHIIIFGFLIDLLSVILFAFLVFALKFLFPHLAKTFFLFSNFFSIVLISYLIKLLTSSLRGVLSGFESFKLISLVSIIGFATKLVVVYLSINSGLVNILLGYLICDAIIFISFFLFAFSKIKFKNFKYEYSFLKKYFHFLKLSFISTSIKSITAKLDILLLNYFTNSLIVGQYETIKKLFMPINFIAPSLSKIIFPKFSKYMVDKNLRKVKETIIEGSKYILLIVFFYILLVLLLSDLYAEYQNIKIFFPVLLVLSFYSILTSTLWWGSSYFQNFNLKFPIYSNIVFLISTLTLIPISFFLIENKLLALSLGSLISYIIPFSMGINQLIKN